MKNKRWIIAIFAVILVMMLSGCGKTTINLNDYMTIEVSGYNTVGKAVYTFDEEAFFEDYLDKIQLKKSRDEYSFLLTMGAKPAELLYGYCIGYLEGQTSGLSNGDEVTLTWSCDDETAKEYFGCKLKYSDMKVKVKGLDEVPVVNLNDYMIIEVSGYDRAGTVEYTFDAEAFYKDYEGKIEVQEGSYLSEFIDRAGMDPVEYFLRYIEYQIGQTSDLSNGDEITLTWKCNDTAIMNYFGYELTYSDIVVKVNGLEELPTFDPFEYLDVEISGISSEINFHIKQNYDIPEMQRIYFEADKSSRLKNGDVVTVTASLDLDGGMKAFAEKYGKLPEVMRKEYVIENQPYYVTSMDQLTEEFLNKAQSYGQEYYETNPYPKPFFDDKRNLVDVSCVGYYFLTPKKTNDTAILYMVYEITVDNVEGYNPFVYYTYIEWEKMVCDGGVIEWKNGRSTRDYAWAHEKFWVGIDRYDGYRTLEGMYNKVVGMVGDYEFTTNIER